MLPGGGIFLAVTAAALSAYAEGVGSDAKGASSADRLIGAATILPAGDDGLVALGGPALRRLTSASRRWETVHLVPGDHSYRVAADPSGRLLAAWSNEPLIHLFSPAQKQHLWFPKPAPPGPDVTSFQIADLQFAPNGRDALVFMSGFVQVNTGAFRGPSWSTAVYRVALDGTSEARLIFRLDHGYRLHTSRFGAVFAMPRIPGQKCDHGSCSIAAIVAYEISGDGARPKTLLGGDGRDLGRARLVRGSNDERIAVMLDAARPSRLELLRWRYGDASPQFRTLAGAAGDDRTALLLTRTDDLIEFRRGDDNRLQVLRHGPSGAQPIATMGALQSADTGLYGVGERGAGEFWVHWGDHLGLVSPDQPPRSFSLQGLLPRRCDWAGDVAVKTMPDHLWVGLDCRGRDYARVSFADAERRARPWPANDQTGVVGTGGEGAVTYARDPSTSGRLVGVTGLRPVPGGLISVGGSTLRRLTPGASHWEVLHEVRGDNLYRVAADDSGRLLASWEKDPFIHLISPEQRQHLTLPKPTMFFTLKNGEQYNALHVESLAFAANGRDALVFATAQVGASARWISAAYWIALDGRSEPRLIFRVDQGLELLNSRRGAVFAIPRDERQECSHQTCWPIAAIVAYEISGDRVTQRTLLDGDRADIATASLVRGSGDERVGLVLDLITRRGPQRLNGGRALLRWRWGDAAADYRSLPGNSTVMPTWLLTATSDFIEVVHKYDVEPERLEIRRYPLGSGEQITTLGPLERRPTPHGVGERSDGGLWLQWGDHLGLLSPGKPPRSYNLDPIVPHGWEWAGAHIYVKTPESLWVGLDGRGRQYVRVDLAEAERRSQIWR